MYVYEQCDERGCIERGNLRCRRTGMAVVEDVEA